ncbi:MAG: radical SAM protein [Deltaproteobacteria bacterium]|nr:radical SAM protein [Deltaproteobacteria bacterium]
MPPQRSIAEQEQPLHRAGAKARVLLLVPPAPFPTGGPPLSLGYLAAALLAAGHEVQVRDLAAPYGPAPAEAALAVERWQPQLVGVSLLTETAQGAYDLVAALPRGRALWLAGGVHATCVAAEPLAHGFDLVCRGEGEQTLVALADRLVPSSSGSGSRPDPAELAAGIAGLSWRSAAGRLLATPDRLPLAELDLLPPPRRAATLFPRSWYLPRGAGPLPAALLTSRGCPGRCTFCCNLVTGRRVRLHGEQRVLQEMRAWMEEGWAGWPVGQGQGQAQAQVQAQVRPPPVAISIHDDAFTADRARLLSLCRAMVEQLQPLPYWWCESRVDGFDPEMARAMKRAGCVAVVFGVESGDPGMLRRIGKGITPEAALAAFAAAKDAGLRTCANFMLGFPGEKEEELGATLALMRRLAPLTDSFSSLGLLVPYPGTAIYRRHAREHGFRRWWLDRARLGVLQRALPPGGLGSVEAARWPELQEELEEAVLAADFFHHPPGVLTEIRECLAFRREHNLGACRGK